MNAIRRWVEESPYTRFLGVELESLEDDRVRLRLPYRDENSNPGKALHGGCAASLAAVAGQVLGRSSLGEGSGPWHTANLQVSYLAAAIGEAVVCNATLLRRGKSLCFVGITVETDAGKPIASATATVRGRFGAPSPPALVSKGDHGESDPGAMGPHLGKMPFIGSRGIAAEHMTGGTSRLVMPRRDANADLDGGVHEGAVLALLDTTGAMASWAESGPGPFKASTPSIQVQIFEPTPDADLVGYGRCARRDGDIFFSDVEIADAATGSITARGTVLYRIVT